MDLQKILLGYIAKQHGITEETVAELLFTKSEEDETKLVLKENALEILLEKDTARVETLKGSGVDKTAIFDEAYAKAKKDELTKAEKRISKAYNIDGNYKLDDLVAKVVEVKVAEATEGTELTDEKVKLHPTYLALEKLKNEEISTLTTNHEAAIAKINDDNVKKEIWQTTKVKILDYFDGLKPVLSNDGAKAARQRSDFATKFQTYEFQSQEGQDDPLVIKDGKRLEDAHGNPVTLKNLVEQTANQFYDFAVQDDKGNAGNGGASGGASGGVNVPKNESEFQEAYFNANSAEERQAIQDAWDAANGE